MKNKAVLAILGFVAALAAFPAMAQKSDSAFYAGLAFGKSTFDTFCNNAGPTCRDQTQSWKVLGGYQWGNYLAVEGAFQMMGTPNDTGTAPPQDFKAQDVEVVAILRYPMAWNFAPYGKAGVYHARLRGFSSASGSTFNEKNYDITFGAGIQWNGLDPLGFFGEVQRYPRMAGGSAGFTTSAYIWSLGAVYRFK